MVTLLLLVQSFGVQIPVGLPFLSLTRNRGAFLCLHVYLVKAAQNLRHCLFRMKSFIIFSPIYFYVRRETAHSSDLMYTGTHQVL